MTDLPEISNEDVRQYGAKLHDEMHGWNCNCAPSFRFKFEEYAERVLADLAAAGRLLPSGGEPSTQFAALGFDRQGRRMPGLVVHHSLEAARRWKERLEADRTIGKVSIAIHQRQARVWGDGSEHYTPWSPVLSDNSEVPNGD